nr:unnamed protein product [Digitaria exilis]
MAWASQLPPGYSIEWEPTSPEDREESHEPVDPLRIRAPCALPRSPVRHSRHRFSPPPSPTYSSPYHCPIARASRCRPLPRHAPLSRHRPAGPYLTMSTRHHHPSTPAVDKSDPSTGYHPSKPLHLSNTTLPFSFPSGSLPGARVIHPHHQATPPSLREAIRKCPLRNLPCRFTKIHNPNLIEGFEVDKQGSIQPSPPSMSFPFFPPIGPGVQWTRRDAPFTTNLATAFVPLDDPRAVISVTLEAPQPSSRGAFTLELRSQARGGHSPSSGVSVTLEAPQPSSRGAFTLEWRFRHPRGSASKLEGGIHPRARKARACDLSSKRMVEAPSPSSKVVAALAAGKRLPPDMAGCPRSRCTPLASADSALAVASPPRTAGFCLRLLRPRVLLFPRPVSSRLAHARLPPAARLRARVDAAHGANTAATSRCRRETSPSCPGLHLVIPEHPSTPLSLLLKAPNSSPSLPRRNRSPEFTELPPPPAHVHSPLHSSSGRTEGTFSFTVPRWCSKTCSPTFCDLDAAAATAVADRDSGHPRPRDLAQTNHGEPLSISPHFPGPVSPPFGRRNHAGELEDTVVSSTSFQGAERKMQGLLVPAAEEIAQESEVNVVHVDPSPEQEYRFEPEGKPRSIT